MYSTTQRTILRMCLFGIIAWLFLTLDVMMGLPFFFIAFLFTALIFLQDERVFFVYLIIGLWYDVQLQLPLFTSGLLIGIMAKSFPYLVKVFRSRFFTLAFELIVASHLFWILTGAFQISLVQSLTIVLLSLSWAVGAYFFFLRLYKRSQSYTKYYWEVPGSK